MEKLMTGISNQSGFIPVGNKVILKEEVQETSSGGIILQNQKKPHKVLVAIGETAFKDMANPPKLGARVLHTEAYPIPGADEPDGTRYFVADDDKILVATEV